MRRQRSALDLLFFVFKRAALKAFLAFAAGMLPILGFIGLVLLLILAFYAVLPSGDLNADNRIDAADAELRQKYTREADEHSGLVRDYYQKEIDHKLEWGLLYAVDLLAGEMDVSRALERRESPPEELEYRGGVVAEKLAPKFKYKPSTITIETTVCTKDGCTTETTVEHIELMTMADTYRGRFYYEYEWKTVTYHPSENVTVTKTFEELKSTRFEEDYSRFDKTLAEVFRVDLSEITPDLRQMVLQMGYGITRQEGEQALSWLLAGPDVVVGAFVGEIPPEYLELFKRAGEKYGIPWYVLAAIAKVESGFRPDAVGPPNYTGELALGMMQFLPSTWQKYGVDANGDGKTDPFDPEDAVYTAARYLAASGALSDLRKALYAYNHANWYVEMVLEQAGRYEEKYASKVDAVLAIAEGYRLQEELGGSGYVFPVAAAKWRISSPFGAWEDFRSAPHRGMDIAVPVGTPALAVVDGYVERLEYSPAVGGIELYLRGIDGNLYYYAHLFRYAPGIAKGSQVKAGQVVAYTGETGNARGAHLHFGVRVNGRWVDPMLLWQR